MAKCTILSLLLIVFFAAGWKVYQIISDYQYGSEVYEQVAQLVVTPPSTEALSTEALFVETQPQEDGATVEQVPLYAQYEIDFDTLLDINSDIIAWLRFDAPESISYPVVGGANSQSYLRRNIYGEYNRAGTLFADENNAIDFSDDNTIIYGHNLINDTMFSKLSAYESAEFYEEYPYFYIYTPDGRALQYEIFAVEIISTTETDRYAINFADEQAFLNYIAAVEQGRLYETTGTIEPGGSLVTLSTCTNNDDTRLVVQAVLLEQYAAS